MEEVQSALRSCLMITKGGVAVDQINKDYREVEGENIPYRKFGYSTLEDFIRDVPRVRLYTKFGRLHAEAIADENSAHLVELISKQRAPRKKKRPARMMMGRRPNVNMYQNRSNGFRAPPRVNRSPVRPAARPVMRSAQPMRTASQNVTVYPAPSSNVTVYPPSSSNVTVYPAPSAKGVTVYPGTPPTAPGNVTVYPGTPPAAPANVTVYPGTPPASSANVTVYPGNATSQANVTSPPANVTVYPGNTTVYPGKPTPTPTDNSRPHIAQASISNLQQRLQKAVITNNKPVLQNLNTSVQNRLAQGPASAPVRENRLQEPPQSVPQSAPVQSSFNMDPLKECLSTPGGVQSEQNRTPIRVTLNTHVPERQVSVPPLVPAQSTPPPLKVRPLSERLKRPSPDADRHVKFSGEVTTHEIPPGVLTPPPEEEDPRVQLHHLAAELNFYPPDYKVSRTGQPPRQVYYCQVSVGGRQYRNYPLDASSEDEAQKLAAAAAVAELSQLLTESLQKKITDNEEIIKQRILALVSAQPYGVFLETIPVCYKKAHGEDLPDNYKDIIERSVDLSLERGIGDRMIVSKFDPEVEKRKAASPAKVDAKPNVVTHNALPQLIVPPEDLWPVYVTHVASVSEVWVRLLENEFQEKFLALSHEMNQHYSLETETTKEVVPLKYYVAKVDDEFHRVRVEEYDPATTLAGIFFIDTGEYEQVEMTRLYPLERRFFSVPAQAIRVCLYGLDKVADCDTTIEIAEKLLMDTPMYMQVLNREVDDLGPVALGIFFDTEGDEDININERITEEIEELMKMSELNLLLSKKTRIFDAFVSHIAFNGDIYMQIKSDGLTILAAMLNNLLTSVMSDAERLRKARFSPGARLDPAETYLAPRSNASAEENFVRVKVAFPSSTNSKMRMIDFGGLLDVDKSKLLKLRELSPTIASFPPQAILIELNNVPKEKLCDEKMLARLNDLAPRDERLVCKVIQAPAYAKPPVVELFKRTQPDNSLISINNTLELEPELTKVQGDGNNNVKTRKRLERTLSRTTNAEDVFFEAMKQVTIPPSNEYFEVHVTDSAASPSNFVVQPYEQVSALEALMKSLQEVYQTYDGPRANLESLREGKVYAARNYAGVWYRVCVHKALPDQLVAVYLLDFGSIEVVAADQLQPLKPEFLELPCQAIRAALFGIQPIHGDWSPQTVLRFQELVVNQNFVSVVRELGTDDRSPTNLILHLDLIDVSADDVDVYIDKVLIDEQRAIPKLTAE